MLSVLLPPARASLAACASPACFSQLEALVRLATKLHGHWPLYPAKKAPKGAAQGGAPGAAVETSVEPTASGSGNAGGSGSGEGGGGHFGAAGAGTPPVDDGFDFFDSSRPVTAETGSLSRPVTASSGPPSRPFTAGSRPETPLDAGYDDDGDGSDGASVGSGSLGASVRSMTTMERLEEQRRRAAAEAEASVDRGLWGDPTFLATHLTIMRVTTLVLLAVRDSNPVGLHYFLARRRALAAALMPGAAARGGGGSPSKGDAGATSPLSKGSGGGGEAVALPPPAVLLPGRVAGVPVPVFGGVYDRLCHLKEVSKLAKSAIHVHRAGAVEVKHGSRPGSPGSQGPNGPNSDDEQAG